MGFTFYATIDSDSVRAYMPDVPYLLPASSWARKGLRSPKLPAHVREVAADCGGFVATMRWGDYKYTPAQYVDWLHTFDPAWAAAMDYCCEPELARVTRERQERTTEMAHLFWREYRGAPWAWVPTVQGWEVADYRRHARELRPLVEEMCEHYGAGSAFRVGIGTLCRRADAAMVRRVARAVADELPGVPLHLWGVKFTILRDRVALRGVASVDSAAWNGLTAYRDRQTYQRYRAQGMSQREYSYQVALPAYLAKLDAALSIPKQAELF